MNFGNQKSCSGKRKRGERREGSVRIWGGWVRLCGRRADSSSTNRELMGETRNRGLFCCGVTPRHPTIFPKVKKNLDL